jgi:hypothetical protein
MKKILQKLKRILRQTQKKTVNKKRMQKDIKLNDCERFIVPFSQFACVCVCVSERERERGREGKRDRESVREGLGIPTYFS